MATGSQTLFLECDLAPQRAQMTSAFRLKSLSRLSSVTAHTLSFLFVMISTSFLLLLLYQQKNLSPLS